MKRLLYNNTTDTSVEYNPKDETTWAGSIDLSGDNTLGYTVNGGALGIESSEGQMQLVVDIEWYTYQ